MPPTEDNKLIARRWLELINEHKIEELCEITAPTWTMHGGPPGGLPPGPEGIRELFRQIGPIEQEFTIEDLIAEGDVVVRATNRCVQESFFGVPGHDRQQTFSVMFIHRIGDDGQILETRRNADDLGRLLQLGARIEPGASEQ